MLEDGDASDTAPGKYFRKRRYAGSKDRRAITERFFFVLRHRAKLDWWIAHTAIPLEKNPRTRIIADLVLREDSSKSAITELFGSTTYAPPALTPDEQALADGLAGQAVEHPDQPAWVKSEFPVWLEAHLVEIFTDRLNQEMAALNEPAPVDLRINTSKTTREEAQALLQNADIPCEPTALSPVGLRLQGHPRVTQTQIFKDGLFEVQDEGSQLAALLVDARPGMTVIDYCAGAGGKTLALADTMTKNNRFDGMLWACDTIPSRLQELEKRANRNGITESILTHILLENDFWHADNANLADRVLADVPCSGTGTWRRAPESRWRLTPGILSDYITQQRQILSHAAALVKSGGRLVYVTCSILPAENEEQIAWFLEDYPRFSQLPVADTWTRTIGGTPPLPDPALRLSPAKTSTDGFFVAILERN